MDNLFIDIGFAMIVGALGYKMFSCCADEKPNRLKKDRRITNIYLTIPKNVHQMAPAVLDGTKEDKLMVNKLEDPSVHQTEVQL
jgi:hypothetical protein